MVHGGRSRWLQLVSLAGSIGMGGLVSVAGCGSRTSMLDPDAYAYGFAAGGDPNGELPTPGGSAGRPGTAGTGTMIGTSGTGTGGTLGKPVPTTGGKGGTG